MLFSLVFRLQFCVGTDNPTNQLSSIARNPLIFGHGMNHQLPILCSSSDRCSEKPNYRSNVICKPNEWSSSSVVRCARCFGTLKTAETQWGVGSHLLLRPPDMSLEKLGQGSLGRGFWRLLCSDPISTATEWFSKNDTT